MENIELMNALLDAIEVQSVERIDASVELTIDTIDYLYNDWQMVKPTMSVPIYDPEDALYE